MDQSIVLSGLASHWKSLTKPSVKVEEPGARRNAQLLSGLLLIVMPVGLTSGLLQLATVPGFVSTFMFILLGISLLFIAYIFSRTRYYAVGALISAIIPSFVSYLNFIRHPDDVIAVGFMVIGVLLGGTLLPLRATFFLALGNILAIILAPLVFNEGISQQAIAGPLGFVFMFSGLILVAKRHRDEIEKARQELLMSTQADLQASHDRLRHVLEDMPVMVYALDQNGNTVMWNGEAQRITGYSAKDIMGTKRAQPIVNWAQYENTDIKGNEDFSNVEINLQDRLGRIRTITVSRLAQQFPVPEWSTWGIGVDITDRKEAQKTRMEYEKLQIEIQKQQLLQASQNKMISIVTHEFRTPLTVIQLAASTIQNYWEQLSDEKRIEKIETISSQIAQLKMLLEEFDIMHQAKQGRFKNEPALLDIVTYSKRIFTDMEEAGGPNRQLIFESNQENHTVYLDANLLRHILTNLLTNAIKYTHDTGSITLSVQIQNDAVVIKVSDDGIGIPETDLPDLFKAFQRASNVNEIRGTGLGLAIVKEIVDLLNGSVHCESTVDVGSTFTVVIPVSSAIDIEDSL